MEHNIGPDHSNALENANRNLLHDCAAPAAASVTPVVFVPMNDTLLKLVFQ